MNLRGWLKKSRHEDGARAIYERVVAAARQPSFYLDLGVPDTPDGRFDMISLHAFLVLRRLGRERERTEDLGQAVFDLMFFDMDQNLREMGVGDLGVGRMVKSLATAFYGRAEAYEKGLDAADPKTLAEALERNVFRHGTPEGHRLSTLAAYVAAADEALAETAIETVMAGRFAFPAPTGGKGEAR